MDVPLARSKSSASRLELPKASVRPAVTRGVSVVLPRRVEAPRGQWTRSLLKLKRMEKEMCWGQQRIQGVITGTPFARLTAPVCSNERTAEPTVNEHPEESTMSNRYDPDYPSRDSGFRDSGSREQGRFRGWGRRED